MSQNQTITPFSFENHAVRTMIINDEPWFVAKDIADALDYSDPSKMYARLEDYEKRKIEAPAELAGTSKFASNDIVIINESGVYSAIQGSRKPEAKLFKKWVNSEVLPSIRKTGSYTHPEAVAHTGDLFKDKYIAALEDKTALLDRVNELLEEKNSYLEAKLALSEKPKRISYTREQKAKIKEMTWQNFTITEIAQALGLNRDGVSSFIYRNRKKGELPKPTAQQQSPTVVQQSFINMN